MTFHYYYSKLCPESLMTLSQLNSFFSNYQDIVEYHAIHIEDIDLTKIDTETDEYDYFKRLSQNETTFTFAKLFVDGNEIPMYKIVDGIKDMFKEMNIGLIYDLVNIHGFVKDEKQEELTPFESKVMSDDLSDICAMCSVGNRYILNEHKHSEFWDVVNQTKIDYLNEFKQDMGYISILEYQKEEVAGFIEGYDLTAASKHGFPVIEKPSTTMITCLEVQMKYEGNGLSKTLIDQYEDAALVKGYRFVQVLACPDEMQWQPISLYKKLGYKELKSVDEFYLLEKDLKYKDKT